MYWKDDSLSVFMEMTLRNYSNTIRTAPSMGPIPQEHDTVMKSGSISPTLVWLRDDLRLDDNPALAAAVDEGRPLVLLWVLDEVSPHLRARGGASRWWLHHSLAALAADVARLGNRLILRRGPAGLVVPTVLQEVGAVSVHWNRRRGRAEFDVDSTLKGELKAAGYTVTSHLGDLLHEPTRLVSKSGTPFRVFTPFWKTLRPTIHDTPALPRPTLLPSPVAELASDDLRDWRLLPTSPDWSGGIAANWIPGEAGAAERLRSFLTEGLRSYAAERDHPALDVCSHLSPHLRFGEISPRRIVAAVEQARAGAVPPSDENTDKFLAELGWREFSHHLLSQFPDLARRNFQPRFDAFPWARDEGLLDAWRRGRTGYPLVDAGMRELWVTGTMHNRVRMVVASFLVKHLLQDWRQGEAWFWDTLVDACPAANPASWQWVAGSGADAAPYFRIFNPVSQGEKFDPDGTYVRRWIPELARLPASSIHAPWTASRAVLEACGIRLGETYPRPVVDHAEARQRALAAFATTSGR